MSRPKRQIKEKAAFTARFIEACGTSRPADIQRLLNVTYQSAKNYLSGRLPHSEILIIVSERTSCSIDWLLTGRGKKFVGADLQTDTPLLTSQMESFVRRICVEVIDEKIGEQGFHLKTVKLQSGVTMSEKVLDESIPLTEGQR